MTTHSGWKPVGINAPWQSPPSSITPAPVIGKLDLLPTDQMPWENFESLLWRILHDVEGLRAAQVYGERGQKQHGLDIVALTPGRAGVAIQCKRLKAFGPAKLRDATTKFVDAEMPFTVGRFVVAVSRPTRSGPLVEELAKQRARLHPIRMELWGQDEISSMLRTEPEIVIQFFGRQTAERFCAEFTVAPLTIPSGDALSVRDALARTPEVVTGADLHLGRADALSTAQPDEAITAIEAAQALLHEAGFPGHAAALEAKKRDLLVATNRGEEAARALLDQVWVAHEQGRPSFAHQASNELMTLSRSITDPEERKAVDQLSKVADAITAIVGNPLGQVLDASRLDTGSPLDHAKLLALAGEAALANMDASWLENAKGSLSAAVDALGTTDPLTQLRLRLLLSEVDDDWADVLEDARKRRLGTALGSLVKARYARRCALRMEFANAESEWNEATADACLAQNWSDGSRWVLSQRAFRLRWRPFTSNEMLPMQLELSRRGPSQAVVPVDSDAIETAQRNLIDDKLRAAAIAALRALRDAVTLGDWQAEMASRKLLGIAYERSGEALQAAQQYAWAGELKALTELGSSESFLDVGPLLDSDNYWTRASAFHLLATQADCVPDQVVDDVVDRALSVLDSGRDGTLVDLHGVALSVHSTALKALAGLADRLTPAQALRLLEWFETQDPLKPDHYRFHDDDEARALTSIALTHVDLLPRAVAHLVALLARSETSRSARALKLLDASYSEARPALESFAANGNTWAKDALMTFASVEPEGVKVDAAFERLTTPLTRTPGVIRMSDDGAVRDSVLIRGLPSGKREQVLDELLLRADDPDVPSVERAGYLVAASNLTEGISAASRRTLLAKALTCATKPRASVPDSSLNINHPLSAFRISTGDECRPQAAFLAARLATTKQQRRRVRDVALSLLGAQESDYWITKALQHLTDDLSGDVDFLSGQGWALRSLAAIAWAKHPTTTHTGLKLARDSDPKVRRALAKALFESPVRTNDKKVREVLRDDPRSSVRLSLAGVDLN